MCVTRLRMLARSPIAFGAVCAACAALAASAQDQPVDEKYTVENYVPEFTEEEITSRLAKTQAEFQRWTGKIPVWATQMHAATTAEWFLDPARTVSGGKVLPGAPIAPLTTEEGEVEMQDGMIRVRLTGWQLAEVPRVLYSAAGERVLLATLGPEARDQRVNGARVTLTQTGQTWLPVEVAGWIATADLISRADALWGHAQALYTANCAQCHAAPHLDEFDANKWSGQFDAMVEQTNLSKGEARLVKTYLQLNAADLPDDAGGGVPMAMGKFIYAQMCTSCHGADGSEGSGGDIRDSDLRTVRNALGGIETMPEVILAESEVRAVAAYLAALKDES